MALAQLDLTMAELVDGAITAVVGREYLIREVGGGADADLFEDEVGTTPAANPLAVNADGELLCWIEEGTWEREDQTTSAVRQFTVGGGGAGESAVDDWAQITTIGSGFDDYNDFFPGGSVSVYVDRKRAYFRGTLYCNTAGSQHVLTAPAPARPADPAYVSFPLPTEVNGTSVATRDKAWTCTVQADGDWMLLPHGGFTGAPNFGYAPLDAVFILDGISYRID